MLKLLLKKQMLEIFQAYFYDAKKNKARSKVSTAMYIALFALLMFGLVGGIFTVLAGKICVPLANAGMDWLYFALMGLIAIMLGAFGSVFNTYAGLYLPKDNDLLLSMPIPVPVLVAARLLGVYLMGLMYSAIVILPAAIVYWVKVSAALSAILGGLFLTFLISVFVLILSCVLGWVVAKISQKLKHKSFITVLVSLVFFGAYYFVYFKIQIVIQNLVANASVYGENIRNTAYPIYLFGRVGAGDIKASAITLAVTAVLFILMWRLLSNSFLQIATSTGKASHKKYKESTNRRRSVPAALLNREFAHFTASPSYMLNCGLGTFLMPLMAVAALWKGKAVFAVLNDIFKATEGSVPLIFCIILCGIVSMNFMTAPSVSLEGKSLWLVQSLPVSPWQVLTAKIQMQVLLTAFPLLLCILCVAAVCPLQMVQLLLIIFFALSYTLLTALFGLYIGIKMPTLTWTNELMPIKQGAPVLITLFAGFGYTALLFIGFMALPGWKLGFSVYMCCFVGINLILDAVLFCWLKNSGCTRFTSL